MSDFHTETRTYAGGSELPQGAGRQQAGQQGTGYQGAPQQGTAQQVRQAAQETAHEARTAAGEVAVTAKDQARTVAHEAREQTRQVLHQLRRHTDEQARHQSRRAAGAIRQWTGELEAIGDNSKPDSPMRGVVQQVAEQGHRAADYLETEGLHGAVRDVQDFARRRPGLFLAGALVAGFLVGRAVKAVASAEDPHADGAARRFDSGTAYGTDADGSGAAYGSGSPSSAPYGTRPPTTYGTGTQHTLVGESVSGSTGTGGPGTGVTASPSYGTGDGYRAGDGTRDGTGTGYTTGARYPSEEIRDGRPDGHADGYPGTPGNGGGPR
ncbi:ATP synthase F0 subunit B [Microbispora catharanthi]|uniref:Uncharacterized protein n=1 Tax=Microbispora catharanthi TaxID=1712871 RepID=A0A5N6BHR0_9ACTN|nr:ATP synthase F0 subunit B [Microbispora catharanthi]KAB8180064.1 hypothetical protein FH610_034090 [Microbispora catharanthi]